MQSGELLAGRYLLEHRAGTGGMGEVWKASALDSGEPVAVKILTGYTRDDAARFTREARILAALDHPGIVRYVSHGASAEGTPFLVMEWLEGEDLSAGLARGRLALDQAVAVALTAADTLGFAHARGVVHRDLKPSNLFLVGGRLDDVKVLDFGIAYAGLSTRVTRTGLLMGTPGYMAPEQARGELHLDARADVFSLGCVLFECLTGEPAFRGEHAAAILTKVLFEDAPRARDLRPEVPEALDALLSRMLAKAREERPSDGRAAAAALRALGEMPATPLVELPAGSMRGAALTGSEQRAAAVILVGPGSFDEAPPSGDAATLRLDAGAGLLREAARYGGAGERLLDGSVAVILVNAGLATDLCAQAARCALALRAHAGGQPIALTMGRSEQTGRSLGLAIDRAAGLCVRAAPEGAVALDEVAAGLLDARFDVREADGYLALHGERPLAESTRLLLGKATPCVGRERELDLLREMLAETAEEGRAQAALVTAPAGAGKSRLAQELLRELRAQDPAPAIWVARADALRAGSPLGMLGQALRSACGVHEGDPLDARRAQLVAHLEGRIAADERRRIAAFLGEMMGVPFPDDDNLPLHAARRDAQLMADQMRAAFLDYVAAACAARPVLVLLEDLHWGDRSTVQLLDAALRTLGDQPLFVLALARPEVKEVFPKLWEGRRSQELRLNELSRRAGERLARHVLGAGADAETIARLVRMSEGNAFYLEELIRWTAEGKGGDMPGTVVAMAESRIKALDDEARRLLRAASVFGEVFWVGGVAALVGGEARRRGVQAALAALVDREILVQRRESRFQGEEEMAFRHALLREGAYAMLTEGDRALGHRLAGEWLEARGEQDARTLAEHFEKGGDGESAGRHYLRAAQQANRGRDAPGSIALARCGLSHSIPGDLRVQLLGALCETAVWLPEMAAHMQREATELSQAAPHGSAPWVQGMLAQIAAAWLTVRAEGIIDIASELQRAEVTEDNVNPLALALALSAYALDLLGRSDGARAVLSHMEGRLQTFNEISALAAFPFYTVMATHADDDLFRGLTYARRCVDLARLYDHNRFLQIGVLNIAVYTWCLGAASEAEQALRALHTSDAEFGAGASYRPFVLAWLSADCNALGEARAQAEQLFDLGVARGIRQDEHRGRWVLSEVLRRAGDLEPAEKEARIAAEALRSVCPLDAPGALATFAAVHLAQGRPAEALAVAEEGMTRYAEMGMCSHFFRGAFLRLVHVECLDAAGRPADARAALAAARDRLHAIAERIPDPTYRRSFLEDVPENRRTLALAREWLGGGL